MFFRKSKEPLKVNSKAPDFVLPSETGEQVRLSAFFGNKCVVLYFYPKDNTRGCIIESSAFRDSYEIFKEHGAEVLGVSTDDEASHLDFITRLKLPFHLLSDKDNAVRRLYNVPETLGIIPGRVTFVIDKAGTIRHVFNSQFNPASHVKQALEILKESPCRHGKE